MTRTMDLRTTGKLEYFFLVFYGKTVKFDILPYTEIVHFNDNRN